MDLFLIFDLSKVYVVFIFDALVILIYKVKMTQTKLLLSIFVTEPHVFLNILHYYYHWLYTNTLGDLLNSVHILV